VDGPKSGFMLHLDDWFRGSRLASLMSRMQDPGHPAGSYFDGNLLKRIVSEHPRGATNHGGPDVALLKRVAASLPRRWQQALKRRHIALQILRGRFRADEPEYDRLASLVHPGDWVLDVGANVGHYTVRLSELVGPGGRVIAFEPVRETMELLAATVARLPSSNVTLMHVAASDTARVAAMTIPKHANGLDDFCLARITPDATALTVLCIRIDSLELPSTVTLAKIDTEGHEAAVLRGMEKLLVRDRPVLIVEDSGPEIAEYLRTLGYDGEKLPGSCNRVFRSVRGQA